MIPIFLSLTIILIWIFQYALKRNTIPDSPPRRPPLPPTRVHHHHRTRARTRTNTAMPTSPTSQLLSAIPNFRHIFPSSSSAAPLLTSDTAIKSLKSITNTTQQLVGFSSSFALPIPPRTDDDDERQRISIRYLLEQGLLGALRMVYEATPGMQDNATVVYLGVLAMSYGAHIERAFRTVLEHEARIAWKRGELGDEALEEFEKALREYQRRGGAGIPWDWEKGRMGKGRMFVERILLKEDLTEGTKLTEEELRWRDEGKRMVWPEEKEA